MVQTGSFESGPPIINSLREHGLLDENDDSQVPLVGWLYRYIYFSAYIQLRFKYAVMGTQILVFVEERKPAISSKGTFIRTDRIAQTMVSVIRTSYGSTGRCKWLHLPIEPCGALTLGWSRY